MRYFRLIAAGLWPFRSLVLAAGLASVGCQPPETSVVSGQAAADFQLELLDGGVFQLSSHRGDNVVMLDFWATWCGPCVKELPILAEVAAEYAQRGVVFCAVNVGEDAETVRSFLASQNLQIMVALDRQSRVAGLYDVRGLPTLLLVDRAGAVQAVHVGYQPGIGDTLRSELDALLSGGRLAAPSPVIGARSGARRPGSA